MQIAILAALSSHVKQELSLAIQRVGMEVASSLLGCSGYVIASDLDEEAKKIILQQHHLGKPILGIGKGAELLVEMGFIPGIEGNKPGIQVVDSLETPSSTLQLVEEYQLNAFTRYLTFQHRLSIAEPSVKQFKISRGLLQEMMALGLTVLRNSDSREISVAANKAGNAMAILPHFVHDVTSDLLFQSMRDYIQEGYVPRVASLYYYPR